MSQPRVTFTLGQLFEAAAMYVALLAGFTVGWAGMYAARDATMQLLAENGHNNGVKIMLKAGADAHSRSDRALAKAAMNGHTETVQTLLNEEGADAHIGVAVAQRLSERNGHTETAEILRNWTVRQSQRPSPPCLQP